LSLINYYEEEIFDTLSFDEFKRKEFIDCTFKSIDCSTQDLTQAKFLECSFEKCNLSNTLLNQVTFRDVQFKDCKIVGVNWSSVNACADLKFSQTILDYCVFHGLNLGHCEFKDCSLKEVDFFESKLVKANFEKSNLREASFNACDLTDADFRQAIHYHIEPEFTKIKGAKFSLPEGISLLSGLGIIIED
jgi:fluoroquinolone resistance protein